MLLVLINVGVITGNSRYMYSLKAIRYRWHKIFFSQIMFMSLQQPETGKGKTEHLQKALLEYLAYHAENDPALAVSFSLVQQKVAVSKDLLKKQFAN